MGCCHCFPKSRVTCSTSQLELSAGTKNSKYAVDQEFSMSSIRMMTTALRNNSPLSPRHAEQMNHQIQPWTPDFEFDEAEALPPPTITAADQGQVPVPQPDCSAENMLTVPTAIPRKRVSLHVELYTTDSENSHHDPANGSLSQARDRTSTMASRGSISPRDSQAACAVHARTLR
eukprot:NODE_10646_length_583_cov_37.206522_g10369_i0.p1 GENE.NODE_10646_length_583_cov_37.206522_g10369_i0~~NODE_10646_length_583_cov_37.206522_g10369_i0.p1  ORF type:complete len:175 (+),score=32.89 NODE_10646_length_583_cov_37.206522_g10369_i0:56-580(+)